LLGLVPLGGKVIEERDARIIVGDELVVCRHFASGGSSHCARAFVLRISRS
jgi:hypothetical protein